LTDLLKAIVTSYVARNLIVRLDQRLEAAKSEFGERDLTNEPKRPSSESATPVC